MYGRGGLCYSTWEGVPKGWSKSVAEVIGHVAKVFGHVAEALGQSFALIGLEEGVDSEASVKNLKGVALRLEPADGTREGVEEFVVAF